MKKKTILLKVLSILMLITHSSLTNAHHAITLNYDTELSGSIEGVVTEVFWANPHVHYYISVRSNEGIDEIWDIEVTNISSMMRQGIYRQSLQVGDITRISGMLGRDGSKRILAENIIKDDGTVVLERKIYNAE